MKNNCDNCVYYAKMRSGSHRYCTFLFRTGHRRPCPPGEGCTVKVGRVVNRRKKDGNRKAAD